MAAPRTISVGVKNRVATITLNRPESMNALSQSMRIELLSAVETFEADENIRIVVIAAAGKGFCSGADLLEGNSGYENIEQQIQQEYKPIFMAIDGSNKLYIASLNGACAGIGVALALCCDFLIMSDNAFLYLPFSNLSLVPDGGVSYHLVRALGYRKALELFIEGGRLNAEQCKHYDLANKVVALEELGEQTRVWAETISQGAPIAQRLGKKVLKMAASKSLTEIIDIEARYQVEAGESEDVVTAVTAFFAKEKPVFKGR